MVKEWNLTDMIVDGALSTGERAGKTFTRDDLTPADVERFESRVDRSAGPDACHEWTGSRQSKGYGRMWGSVSRRPVNAHRVAYVLAYGLIPAGLVVRHRCDNPPCCNPAHLTLGTQRDNVHDRDERDRQAQGESHGQAKLTVEAVNDMRRRARAGATYVELADEYGVETAAARLAIIGRWWKSATEPPVTTARAPRGPHRAWTPAEDAVLFDDPVKVVAERLDRTVSSVANRRHHRRRQAVTEQ